MKSLRTLQLASAVLFLLFLAPLANAQLAVYGTVMLTNYGYSHSSNGFLYYNDTGGLGAGATYLFESQSRLKAGLDFRVAGSPGADGGENGAASLRIAFVPRQNRLRPYFQLGGGFVSTTYPVYYNTQGNPIARQTQRISGPVAAFAVGLDIRVNSSFDIRLPELASDASGKVASASFGAGVVYHIRPRARRNP
jgi:hypothetical protein